MKGIRQAWIPIDHFVSELAAAPLGWEELVVRAPTYLDPAMLGDDVSEFDPSIHGSGSKLPGVALGGPEWREVELALLRRFPSFSVDEVVAFRDQIWFGDEHGARVGPRRLGTYTRSLAIQLLHVDGPVARPRTPLWRMEPESRRPESRVAAQWMGFALPVDFLVAAHPGSACHITQYSLLAHPVEQSFREKKFAETHCHLGNALPFDLFWIWAQRAVADERREDPAAMFAAPGSPFQHGRGLAGWLLTAAVARWTLARFMVARAQRPVGSFEEFLRQSLGPGEAYPVCDALCRFVAPPPSGFLLDRNEHACLAGVYAELSGIRLLPASDWYEQGLSTDPLTRILTASTGSGEQQLVRDGLAYLDELDAAPAHSAGDELFERVFWQAVRVRNLFYRTLVQQPMTAGLMWFVRFNARGKAARKRVARRHIVHTAAVTCGAGRGLHSLEIRIPPPKDHREAESWVQAIRASRDRFAAPASSPHGAASPHGGPPEIGLVIHFSRDRGGSWRDAQAVALRVRSHADPGCRENCGVRYRAYALNRWREATILASFLRQYPASLRVFRGLDVCSDELGIPVWALAAVIRGVRRASERASAALLGARGVVAPALRVTAHAGEDFVHLLGGLRRVHETMSHLATCSGDRIGHALALGVDPEEWARNSGACAVNVEERLFDLVWAWHYITSHKLNVPGSAARKLEHEIAVRSCDIFGDEHTPFVLQRFVESLYGDTTTRELWALAEPMHPDQGDEVERPSETATLGCPAHVSQGWGQEVEHLRSRWMTEPELFDRGSKIVIVDPDSEVPMLAALQDALRRDLGERELAVEVNPSSNLLIGNLSDLKRHPLWRLSPPLDHASLPPIHLVVGSDNPLMLSTDTLQEYQRLHDAMRLSGVSERAAWDWVERAREAGLRYRFTLAEPPLPSDTWRDSSVQDPLEGWERDRQQSSTVSF